MKPSSFLLLFCVGCCSLFALSPASRAATPPASSVTSDQSAKNANSTVAEHQVTIPGPLRSFLRMSGISQEISTEDVLPILAHNVILHGYELGRPTEYLILLRRYVQQAGDLTTLAGQTASLRVQGCKDPDALLHTLGYRIEGECGHDGMTLVTADPEKAFLTIDSGFPLLQLEQALQHDAPFTYPYLGNNVPVLFTPAEWVGVSTKKDDQKRDFLDGLLYEPQLARLYWAMSRIEPQTRLALKNQIGLERLFPLAPTLDLYGSQILIRDGAVVVPGGKESEKDWQFMASASPRNPVDFVIRLMTTDRGWLAAYYDAMARTSASQQAHFAANHRFKNYYAAFRSPGASAEAGARVAFRPAPALMVLTSRLQWDANSDPYVPGGLQAWSEILRQRSDNKFLHGSTKHFSDWRNADQLAEAMFVFSRVETDSGPVQAFLCLSELDHRRGPSRPLSPGVVELMAQRYVDFSDQYLIFSEFPDLNDESITHFLRTAEGLSKISDHALRGNAMGIFQANVGFWQILARQGQIDPSHLNSSWMQVIQPFDSVTSDAQLVSVARASLEQVLLAATGKTHGTQDDMINLLAGAPQTSAEGQQMHKEMANRIRLVLDDQRLVSLDTLFALDDGLKKIEKGDTAQKAGVEALAGELREFEMPRPIFTNSERSRWAAGTYNNRHTEQQMRTDLLKTLKPPTSPKQVEAARGQLATFIRDSLVGMNYAYYEPPGSQVLHNNPLFVRSHDFSGDTVIGADHLWQAPRLFGSGSPAGGGAHLIGSLADLPYALSESEQDFIAPDHVQALIWQQFVPGLLTNAIVPRWWNVSRNEVHAVALYQRAGEELLTASLNNDDLRVKVVAVLSDRLFPERRAWLEQTLQSGKRSEVLEGVSPADTFFLTAQFRAKYPEDLERNSPAGKELDALIQQDPQEVSWERLSRDFGVIHPVFTQTYAREFISVRPFPALGGNYSRLMGECWDSGNLYWARLADDMGYSPVVLNRMVPDLTRRMVERIAASELEDWPATLRALRETGDEVRQGKTSLSAGVAAPGK